LAVPSEKFGFKANFQRISREILVKFDYDVILKGNEKDFQIYLGNPKNPEGETQSSSNSITNSKITII